MDLSLVTAESFDAVMRLYTPTVYRIALTRLRNPTDAEDITQDVFVRYFKADLTYDSEEHRKAWLIRCAVNCANTAASTAERRHRDDSAELEKLVSVIADPNTPEEAALRDEQSGEILKAVMSLKPKYRTAIYLFYYEELSTSQIAEITKTRESTVRSQLTRGRELLKKILEIDHGFDYNG